MIDSVLKGTGNSRFLKSALPAGTSWADALAMLQAGTFPIDFNGINAEGFQQVGTPLNKANLLKDATAAQIGLPPSTTPDGMFQALGNTGELHVWRKTVVTSQEIPAGYKLGSVQTGGFTLVSSNYITYEYGTPTISDDGTVGLSVVGTMNVNYQSNLNDLKGKFCRTTASGGTSFPDGQVIFIPGDAVFSTVGVTKETNKYQPVTGYAKIPAGTTTTYPVSTNPNAYQEGEYGKAGYTLGDVKTGTFQIGQGATTIAANRAIIKYGTSVSVTDTGTASIASESELTVTSDSSQSAVDKLKGKFFRFSQLPFSSSAFSVGTIYFFPANTVFTKQSSGNWYASKYQTVTSHGKTEPEYTIEYLGKLGDKARAQFGSYVGTGTYGKSNQNTLNLSFTPKFLLVMNSDKPTSSRSYANFALFVYGVANGITVGPSSANYEIPLYATWNKNSVSWYNSNSDYGETGQMNNSGITYRYVAIG